jgi:hypothetical protein
MPCAHSASLLPRAHPAPLAPTRRARRPLGRTKPGATSDGDGGGARATPASTLAAIIARPHIFVRMFQVFYTDVTKVDRDIAYVAMIVHVCCKYVYLDMCICFTHMFAIVFHVFLHTF